MNIFIIFLSVINFVLSFNIFNMYHNNLINYKSIYNFSEETKKLMISMYFKRTSKDFNQLESESMYKKIILHKYNTSYNISYNITLLKTSILNFIPILKLHHIILLYDKKYNNIYTIDFSPINQSSTKTLLKLLFNKNVNAEIRVRLIKNIMLNDSNKIIEQWNNINKVDYITSQKITYKTYNNIYNSEIKDFIKFIINHYNKNGNFMNLYTNNCQTFSKFILYIQKDLPF
jgi:hypothetical protein